MGTVAPPAVEEYVATLPEDQRELARHVLLGHINEKTGRPVGFHHAPNGVPPPGRRIDRVLERYSDGSYRAIVSFYDARKKKWVQKDGDWHTMFPDHWTRDEVIAAGQEAYQARVDGAMRKWKGRGRGLTIRGYHRQDGHGAATFYPGWQQ